MPRLLLLHTGGTLGMAGHPKGGLRPSHFFRTLKARAPELFELADLEFELFSNLDSAEMQPELWSQLAERLHARLSEFDGAVVTHGTDTLAYTASALSFLLPNLDKPVVLTGAQRPLGEIRSDARLNLIDAVTCALRGPQEVTVCFDSRLYRGNRVQKTKISEFDAFDSPNLPPLGSLGVNAHFEPGLRRKGKRKLLPELNPKVFLLRLFPGLSPELALSLLDRVEGLVLEAYGAGNFPLEKKLGRSLRPLFEKAQQQEIPVVILSQSPRNGVDLSLYQSGVWAQELGAVSGGDMTSSAAVVKLMHALAQFRSHEKRRSYLLRSVAGERSEA